VFKGGLIWGPGVPEHSYGDTSFRDFPSPHHIYVLYHAYNDRAVSIKGHCVSGTFDLGDQGSQNMRTGTHRFKTSRHPA